MKEERRNGGPQGKDLSHELRTELQAALKRFGVSAEALLVQGTPASDPLRILVREQGGEHGQLRIYPAAPEASRRLVDALAARAHLASGAPDRLLEPRPADEGAIWTEGGAHHLYLRLPTGAQPIPPAWDIVAMVQLGSSLGDLARASEGYRAWSTVPTSSDWLAEVAGRVARIQRLEDPASGCLSVLPESVGERIRRLGEVYARIAESDAGAARERCETYDSALWDAAGARRFVLDAPSPADLFVGTDRRIIVAWPERIAFDLAWRGMLGEIARGRVTEDLDLAAGGLLAAHRVDPLTIQLIDLLEIEASPVAPYLRTVEEAVADAPVRNESALLQLFDRHLSDPLRRRDWCTRLTRRLRDATSQSTTCEDCG